MNKYGDAALLAVRLFNNAEASSPQDAWKTATIRIFGNRTSGQIKGCPKGAFLGLCEQGLVKGIPPGKYTQSTKNKSYAVSAISLLKMNPSLGANANKLWNSVVNGETKQHNSQMKVVIALWENNFIA